MSAASGVRRAPSATRRRAPSGRPRTSVSVMMVFDDSSRAYSFSGGAPSPPRAFGKSSLTQEAALVFFRNRPVGVQQPQPRTALHGGADSDARRGDGR